MVSDPALVQSAAIRYVVILLVCAIRCGRASAKIGSFKFEENSERSNKPWTRQPRTQNTTVGCPDHYSGAIFLLRRAPAIWRDGIM